MTSAFQASAPEVHSSFFTSSDGIRLHYLSAGSGPTIIFIPGWTMPAWIWEHQIEYFSKKHQVVALDSRAQGESDPTTEGLYPERRAQDIHELIQYLDVSPVVLIGWSEGAGSLYHYVEVFGTDTISALAIVDCEFKTTESDRRGIEGFLRQLIHNRAESTARFVRGMYGTPQTEEYLQRVIAASMRTPTASAVTIQADYLSREPEWDKTKVVEGLDRPFLYTATKPGESYALEVQKLLPTARVELFTEAGHALFVDESRRFNRIVDEWLEQAGLSN